MHYKTFQNNNLFKNKKKQNNQQNTETIWNPMSPHIVALYDIFVWITYSWDITIFLIKLTIIEDLKYYVRIINNKMMLIIDLEDN